MGGVLRDIARCWVIGMLLSLAMANGNVLREPGITVSQDSTEGSQNASLAVDGNRDVNSIDKCSQTSKVDKPWWEVNLGKNYTLFSVKLWNIPGSFVNDVTVCKTTAEGTEYRGKLASTKSGTTCLDWSTHPKWTPPDGADAANYCRNPDGAKGPWCFIGQGYSDYEYCDVPWCPLLIANDVTVCKTTVEGTEYRGKLATTKSGAPCTDWSTHSKYPPPDGANAANYCRNPDNHPKGPWCYIGPGDSDHEFCDVPRCPLQRKLGNFNILLDDNVCYSNNTPEGEATKGTQEIRCSTPVVGQRLKIQLKDSPTVLTLCEVSVQAYQYRVTSPDGVTKESRSSIKTPEDVPPAPEVTEASSGPKTISIKITPPDPSYGKITKYQIEWWKESGDSETKDLEPDQLSYTFSNLTMSATYHFKARARTLAGWGDWSKEITIDTKETLPGQDSWLQVWPAIALTVGIIGILAAAIIPAAVIMVWKKRDQRMKTYESPMRMNNRPRQPGDGKCNDGIYEVLGHGANPSDAQPDYVNVPKTTEKPIYENTRAPGFSKQGANAESSVREESVHEQEYENPSFDLSE